MKENFSPPKYPLRFFRWFCHPKLRKYIEGDLMELYGERFNEYGKRRADWKFIVDILLLFRPGIIKPSAEYQNLITLGMYKSYLKVGWRNLLRSKGYSMINIGGLASGMAIAMLIGLWIWDEMAFDTNHQNYDRLVQVMQHQTVDGKTMTQVAIPLPLETSLREVYGTDFEHLAMSTWTNEHILSSGEKNVLKTGNYVQPGFPEMLSLNMIGGTRKGLKDRASILLSESAARALFGNKDPMNQLVRIDNTHDVKVTGVYEDLPYNSTLRKLQFISNWELFASEDWVQRARDQWDNNSFQLFGQVAAGLDVDDVSAKIKSLRADRSGDKTYKPEVFLNPMRDWHLRSRWENGIKSGGQIQMVWMFGIVGAFVLFLACINFMNISTARSEKRAKEVGIRMTIGSVRSQLINQFLTESFLVVALACIVAAAITALSLPWFNDLADKKISMQWSNPVFWLTGISFVIVTSLVAGSYPAFFLSSFRPINVLKSTFNTGKLSSLPRKILVVVQFTVSITLVFATLIVNDQIQFLKDRPIGYDRDKLILVQVKTPDFVGKYEVLRTDLINSGAAKEVAESSSPLTQVWSNSSGFNWPGKDPKLQSSDFGIINVTHEYGSTVGWTIAEGRDFSRDFSTDSSAILLNEAAVKFIGTKEPVGMEITRGDKKLHVVGVIKDVVMEVPYSQVRPNIYLMDNNYLRVNWINIRLNSARPTSESLATIEAVFKKYAPSVPFDYKFADDEYAKKFTQAEHIGQLSYVFAGLATFISCLGLIGLASFVAERHTKEIGIRKVLGASIAQLWRLLSGNFLVLVTIASLVAVPLASYVMNYWLQNFHYHTEISWRVFVITVSGALGITLITVSYQAIRAAMANPVKSLRSE